MHRSPEVRPFSFLFHPFALYPPPAFVTNKRNMKTRPAVQQEALDHITRIAGDALGVAATCAFLVNAERRLLTSSYGMPVPTALLVSHAFWKHLMAARRPLVVTDGRCDPLVSHNPAVRDGTVRACVGIPLRAANGRAVGTLLAMDRKPRGWTAPELDFLGTLSELIVRELELVVAVRRTSRSDVSRQPSAIKPSVL